MQIASTWNHANKGCSSSCRRRLQIFGGTRNDRERCQRKHDNLQEKEDNGGARDPRSPISSTIRSAFVRDRGSGSEEKRWFGGWRCSYRILLVIKQLARRHHRWQKGRDAVASVQ